MYMFAQNSQKIEDQLFEGWKWSQSMQSCTQSPQALWPAVGCQERLWGTGILLP